MERVIRYPRAFRAVSAMSADSAAGDLEDHQHRKKWGKRGLFQGDITLGTRVR